MPTMEKFCYFCALRTGAIITALYCGIWAGICYGIIVLRTVEWDKDARSFDLATSGRRNIVLREHRLDIFSFAVQMGVNTLLCILLIVAVIKRRPSYVTAFMFISFSLIVLELVYIIGELIDEKWEFVVMLPLLFFSIYLLVAMYFYRLELIEEQRSYYDHVRRSGVERAQRSAP